MDTYLYMLLTKTPDAFQPGFGVSSDLLTSRSVRRYAEAHSAESELYEFRATRQADETPHQLSKSELTLRLKHLANTSHAADRMKSRRALYCRDANLFR
jgi:hypothetical protein